MKLMPRIPAPSRAGLALAILLAGLALAQEPDRWEVAGAPAYPEGIVTTDGGFLVSATVDGTIFRGDLSGGSIDVFAAATQPMAAGMAIDDEGALWVAGGSTGNVYRYDVATGVLTGVFTSPPSANIYLNDLALGIDGSVYVTDSNRPVMYRIPPAAAPGPMDAWIDFAYTPVTYHVGFNLNGIVMSPDDRWLVVVQTNTGRLFRIDVSDRSVLPIEVEADLTNGDGLVLDGQTLYVVRNENEEIVPVVLSEDFARGEAARPIRADAFTFPTAAALVDGALLVVDAQVDDGAEPGAPADPAVGAGGGDDAGAEARAAFAVLRIPLP